MFIILSGHCKYKRFIHHTEDHGKTVRVLKEGKMNRNYNQLYYGDYGKDIEFPEVIGPGDFSLLDGSDVNSLDFFLRSSADRSLSREQSEKIDFEAHAHGLTAVTHVELITIPLHEIAKCLSALQHLMKISMKLYPRLYKSDEEVIEADLIEKNKLLKRREIVGSILQDRHSKNAIYYSPKNK